MTNQQPPSSSQDNGKRKAKADLLLVGVVVLLALLALFLYQCTGEAGAYVVVLIDGKETARYDITKDLETVIETPDGGMNVLCIQNGVVTIKDANCPDGVCAAHAPISKTNSTIVCLPHKLVVKVVGAEAANVPDITV